MEGVRVVSVASAEAPDWARGHLELKPTLVLQGAIFLIVVGNVGRIPFLDLGERTAPILVNDICMGAAFIVGLLVVLRDRSLRLSDTAVAGLLFAGVGALSAIAGIQRFGLTTIEVLGSLAYLARWMLYFSLYIVIINAVRARDVEGIWGALEWAVILIAAFGIVQSIFLPNFAFIVYPDARSALDWDEQRHRLVSTILDPNFAAAMLMMILLVQLARLASGARVALWKPLLLFAALVMTLSRGGMLSFLIGCVVLLPIIGLSKRVARLGAVIGVLLLAATPKLISFAAGYSRFGFNDDSAMTRVLIWQRAAETFLDYPIFGIGFNTYGFVQERRGYTRNAISSYSAEGGLLFVAVLTGLVGLTIFVAMMWFALQRSRRAARHPLTTPGERGILRGTVAITVAILVNSMFVNSLLTPWTMELVLVLWGLAFVIASDLRRRDMQAASGT